MPPAQKNFSPILVTFSVCHKTRAFRQTATSPVELRCKSSEDSEEFLLHLLNLRKAMHRSCKTWKKIFGIFRGFASSCKSWKKSSQSLEDYHLLVSLGRKSSQSSEVFTSSYEVSQENPTNLRKIGIGF